MLNTGKLKPVMLHWWPLAMVMLVLLAILAPILAITRLDRVRARGRRQLVPVVVLVSLSRSSTTISQGVYTYFFLAVLWCLSTAGK